MDDIMNGLMASTHASQNKLLAANGLPIMSTASTMATSPTVMPQITDIVKEKLSEHTKALEAMKALYLARGIDPANPEAALAKLMPKPEPTPSLPKSGFLGAEQLSDIQSGTQQLNNILDLIKSKIIPS
jgi:hypothetical protein